MPCGSPPGIGEQAEQVASLAQFCQRLDSIREYDCPPIDGLCIAIEGYKQLLFAGKSPQELKPLSQHIGRGAACLLFNYSLPMLLFCLTHCQSIRLPFRPVAPGQLCSKIVVRERPTTMNVLIPIRPIYQSTTKIENYGSQRHCLLCPS